VVTLQLVIVLLVGVPLLAVTQPFVPGPAAAILLLVALAVLGFGFWRSAANLQGHVRAGAQVIVEALANQARSGAAASLGEVVPILPGMGEPEAFRLEPGNAAVGKTLAQLDLRGLTGATVLVITRPDGAGLVPTAHEVLRAGDILALAGSHEALDAAKQLLAGG
jgi:CPA2 family monovalent cation:H+ antiporter-2